VSLTTMTGDLALFKLNNSRQQDASEI
jgi:hypothetical protein